MEKQLQEISEFVTQVNELRSSIFDSGNPIHINRSPGRLDLMGGNDDYTGGLVFETTIRETTTFAAQRRNDTSFVLYNPSVRSMGWDEKISFDISVLMENGSMKNIQSIRDFVNENPKRSWITYIVGGLCYIAKQYPEKITSGLNMFLDSDIPLGKGVSSSAALETSALKACAASYGITIEGLDLAYATQWVECEISGAAAGIMDQYAVALGDKDMFTPMICQPCIPLEKVKLPSGIKIWGIDSGVRHSVGGIAYEAARAACFMGYQLICQMENIPVNQEQQGPLLRYTDPKFEGYLARITPMEFRSKYEDRLPEKISGAEFKKDHPEHFDPYTRVLDEVEYPIRKAVRYAVEENNRVTLFYQILRGLPDEPDELALSSLAELMYGAHLGYTDCGLGCEETDMLVSMARRERANDLYGAKITGGGAGGTVAILGRNTVKAEETVRNIFESYKAETGNEPWLFEGSTEGADAFGIVTI